MAEKKINKILWHGNELDADGNAEAPAVATGADGLDGLNDGEVYICDADKDPAMFIKTDAGRVARLGGSGGDTYTKEQINQLLAGKVDTAFFSRLFGLMTDAGGEIAVNDVQTEAASIFAKLGLYTNSFLSALGLDDSTSGGGGGGGASTLGQLNNVGSWADEMPTADRVLVQLAGATHWSSKPLSEIVGLDTAALADYLAENGYATQSWVTGQGYATQSWVTGKGYLTSVSLATISDLHSSWDELLGAAPSDYVTRWPTFAEVTDKPTTLAGYGITDAYTKQETDTKLSGKLDQSAFDELFEKVELSDGTLAIHAKLGLYTDGFLSALGIGTGVSGGGGGTSYDRLDAWADYTAAKAGWVLSAALGEDLNTRVAALEGGAGKVSLAGITDLHSTWDALLKAAKPATLAGYGITDAYTKTDADGRYVLKTGDTMTGTLRVRSASNPYGALLTGDSTYGFLQFGDMTDPNGTHKGIICGHSGRNLSSLSVRGSTNNVLDVNGNVVLNAANYASTLDSRYVKKSGDTMTGTLTATYFISTAALYFGNGGYSMGRIAISPESDKALIIQAATNGGIRMAGRDNSPLTDFNVKVSSHSVATINDQVIWTAGNDGSGSGLDADTVDGVHATDFARYNNHFNLESRPFRDLGYAYGTEGWPFTGPAIAFGANSSYSKYIGGNFNSNTLFLAANNNGTMSSWREFAFTDSNVASATKLQTARTIWGQPFDGTGNVSGKISNISALEMSGTLTCAMSGQPGYIIYRGIRDTAFALEVLDGYNWSQNGLELLTSGNIRIKKNLYVAENIGIGTESPAYKLHVSGDAYASGYFKTDGWFQNNVNGCGLYNSAQDARWYASGGAWNTDKPIIPKANNLYSVGTLSYRFNYGYFTNMNVNAIIAQSSNLVITATTLKPSGDVLLENGAFAVRNNLSFATYNTAGTYCALLGIDGSNYAFVGTTEQTAGTIIRGYEWVAVNFNGLNNSITFSKTEGIYSKIGVYSDGYISALGNNTSSDMRLKTKLSDIALTPKDIANAPAMLFAWKKNGMKDVGSSAQYWKNVLPDAVKERDGWLEMAYGNIALVSAISIAKKVVSHEERIAQLEKENIGLKNKIKELERRV